MCQKADARQAAFLAHLTEKWIAHTITDEGVIRITEHFEPSETTAFEFPDALIVEWDLILRSTRVSRLPSRLVVGKTLYIYGTHITELPEDLSIGANLTLSQTKISRLPDNLTVPGSLRLSSAPIPRLPHGLTVGGGLDIEWSGIDGFPDDLRVRGLIVPPRGLPDLVGFLDTCPNDVVTLSLRTTRHAQLDLLARLQPFPDLLRVVRSLGTTRDMHLSRCASDAVDIRIEAITPVP